MRFATIVEDGRTSVAVVDGRGLLPLTVADGVGSLREIAASGDVGLQRISEWADRQPNGAYRPIEEVEFGPAVPDPGAIYTIGLNYSVPGEVDDARPQRPMVYAKLPTAVTGHNSVVTWDRSLTANVDAEAELGVVIGERAEAVAPRNAMAPGTRCSTG